MSRSRPSTARLWAQTATAVFALAIGSFAVLGTAVGVAKVYATYGGGSQAIGLAGIMIGSAFLTISFGAGIGLGIATALEARARANARRTAGEP